jgi:hypothetical protein
MNFDTDSIRNIITNGHKYYSVTDSIKEYIPGAVWDGEGAQVYLETSLGREGYSDKKHLTELLQKIKPPDSGGFDNILRGILRVPKK